MRITINLFFLTVLFLLSCGAPKVPPGVLNHEDMASLLTDVHLVDGSLYNQSPMPDSLYKYAMSRYDRVFKQHHTDSVQFQKSLKYYSLHPDQFSDIYTQVTQTLKDKNDKLIKQPIPKNAVPKQ